MKILLFAILITQIFCLYQVSYIYNLNNEIELITIITSFTTSFAGSTGSTGSTTNTI